MGYDITVTTTEFHRWFSIWNWHRCLVIAFAGLGLIDDEETERQLMMVTSLQHTNESNMDPKDEDEARFRVQTAKKSDEAAIIQTSYDYDRDGRIIGGNAMVPVSMEMKIDDSFNEGILSMLRMQTETNHLLMDHREELDLTIDEAKRLHSMCGEEIGPFVSMTLATGAILGLQRCSSEPIAIWEAFEEIVGDPINEDKEHPGRLYMLKRIEEAGAHVSSFALDELWEEVGAIGSFCGVLFDAAFNQSTITIT